MKNKIEIPVENLVIVAKRRRCIPVDVIKPNGLSDDKEKKTYFLDRPLRPGDVEEILAENRTVEEIKEYIDSKYKTAWRKQADIKSGYLHRVWTKNGVYYNSVDHVEDKLPPGLYSMFEASDGKRLFSKVISPSDGTVSLPGLPSQYILEQIHKFWQRADTYKKYGFLHKRGILMYGPPGCGKTSIIQLLMQELIKSGGVIFNITDFRRASGHISEFRRVEPERPIMTLMEDVEGLFDGDAGPSQIQAALSLLDGQDQVNNIVHIATSNKPEKLADRFIKRPGRFDLVLGILAPKAETREAYLRHVTRGQVQEDKLKELVEKTEGLGLSYLRELASTYLCLDIPLEETLARLKENFKDKKIGKKDVPMGFVIGYNDKEKS